MGITYSTQKEVVIKSVKLRLFKLFIQLIMTAYLIWVILYEHGYQEESIGFGFTQVSVTGCAYGFVPPNDTVIVWDEVNVVFPSKEHDAVFVTTNYLWTPQQHRTNCTGTTDCSNCTYLQTSPDSWGLETGTCNITNNLCILYAWCPIENETIPTTRLLNMQTFNLQVRTFADWDDGTYAVNNLNNGDIESGYNSFSLPSIVEGTGYTLDEVAIQGEAVGFITSWECNFDAPLSECEPSFNFIRLDDPDSTLSSGYNFRYVNIYRINDGSEQWRDLFKVYGIRVIFLTNAIGYQFSLVATLLKIASVIGMMFLANYIADVICMWVMPYAGFYRNRKYMNVDEQKKEAARMEWRGLLTEDELNRAYF